MVENQQDLFFVLAAVLLLFLVSGGFFYLYLRERNRACQATTSVIGEVIGHARGRGLVPVVQYQVDGKDYKMSLEYRAVVTVSTPFKSPKAQSPFDPLAERIVINRNSLASYSVFMKEWFPIGSHLTVYYNPNRPKESYVERYAGLDYFWKRMTLLMLWVALNLLVLMVNRKFAALQLLIWIPSSLGIFLSIYWKMLKG